jgi:hypothetical protein
MLSTVYLRDFRLAGEFSQSSAGIRVYTQTPLLPVQFTLQWIASDAKKHGGISVLQIMCHGYENWVYAPLPELNLPDFKIPQHRGGFGLELGEGVDASNAHIFSVLAGFVKTIVIHSCSAADTAPGVAGSNGQQMCRLIAKFANAEVIAASQTQWYTKSGMDFGAWEGPVFRFKPDGSISDFKG